MLVSGDLGAPRRTVGGLLGLLELMGLSGEPVVATLMDAGLPARAYEEPDFPISLEQDLAILAGALNRAPRDQSIIRFLFESGPNIHISGFGILGLAMQQAPTMKDAIAIPLTYPQLSWGRSRVTVWQEAECVRMAFIMDRKRLGALAPADADKLYTYALVLDAIGSYRLFADIGAGPMLRGIELPFKKPRDWRNRLAPVPVTFGAAETALIYDPATMAATPLYASALGFKSSMKHVERDAQMLAEAESLTERVSRWLWAYAPPLKKSEIAKLLGLSERSLTRLLDAEGTSYQALAAKIQEERARNLLANPDLTISEIGYRLGYTEPAAFSRAFTGWCGLPPSRYRAERLRATTEA